jgi:hypothetical protein
MAFSLMLIKQRTAARQQAAKHSNIRTRFNPVAERRSILKTVSHEPAEKHANNRVEFCKEFFTHVFDTGEAARQRSHTFRGVCTKLPVCKLRMPTILRSGSRQPQTNNRVEFRKEFLKHVFVKRLPAKQRSQTFRVHVCPNAPPRKKRTANIMLEHHRSELQSCNLATRFEELQVEEEVRMEETHRVEEVVEFAPQEEETVDEVQYNDVGHVPADPVVLRSRRTSLQREAAALSCDLGTYWSEASPRRLRRSTRARKQPDRFIPSF